MSALSAASALPELRSPAHAQLFEVAPARDRIAFEIGRDHARYALPLPAEFASAGHPMRQGWLAGQAVFGARARRATPFVTPWLALRAAAWQRGEPVEDLQLTPNFLARIAVTHCPVTREALTHDTGGPTDAVFERANPQAAWAAGNVLMMSQRARKAREGLDWRGAVEVARRLDAAGAGGAGGGVGGVGGARGVEGGGGADAAGGAAQAQGLRAADWWRLAVLSSFATPLPHAAAAALPLALLPPPRLRVLNPVQSLQLLLTLRFTEPGEPARLEALARLLPETARTEFFVLGTTLMARRIDAGDAGASAHGAATLRRAMTTAWLHPLVQQRWQRLALRLDARQCEQLVEAAVARKLADQALRCLSLAQATDGWGLGADAKPSSRAPGRPADHTNGGPVDRMTDRPSNRPSDRPTDRLHDRFHDRLSDRLNDRLSDQLHDQLHDQRHDHVRDPIGHITNGLIHRITDRTGDRTLDHAAERATSAADSPRPASRAALRSRDGAGAPRGLALGLRPSRGPTGAAPACRVTPAAPAR